MYEWLPSCVAKAIEVSDALHLTVRWETEPGAAEKTLRHAEQTCGIRFPPSLRAFLQLHDGATLTHQVKFGSDVEECRLTIFPAIEIAQRSLPTDADLEHDYRRGMLLFAELPDLTGEHPMLESSVAPGDEFPVLIGDPNTGLGQWRQGSPIAASFGDLIYKMLASLARGNHANYWEGEGNIPLVVPAAARGSQ